MKRKILCCAQRFAAFILFLFLFFSLWYWSRLFCYAFCGVILAALASLIYSGGSLLRRSSACCAAAFQSSTCKENLALFLSHAQPPPNRQSLFSLIFRWQILIKNERKVRQMTATSFPTLAMKGRLRTWTTTNGMACIRSYRETSYPSH